MLFRGVVGAFKMGTELVVRDMAPLLKDQEVPLLAPLCQRCGIIDRIQGSVFGDRDSQSRDLQLSIILGTGRCFSLVPSFLLVCLFVL